MHLRVLALQYEENKKREEIKILYLLDKYVKQSFIKTKQYCGQ